MRGRRMTHLLFVVSLIFTVIAPVTAHAQDSGTSVYLPLIVNGASVLDGSAAVVPRSTNGVYIVVMKEMPVVAYEGDVAGFNRTKPAKGAKLDINSAAVQAYDRYLVVKQDATLHSVGGGEADMFYNYTIALNGFAATLSPEQIVALQADPNVLAVLPDEMRYAMTDSSPGFLGLTGGGGAWREGYTGEGVIVGVIDTGIWPEHPSFADDGSYAPAPALDNSRPSCEFGNSGHNPADAAFTCNNKLIGARQMLDIYRTVIGAEPAEYDSARDDDGHGTHTASTAAGNHGVEATMYGVPRGTVSGIAPRAHVISYKGLGDLGGFTADLTAAIDQAVADGVDVINYSVGGGAGPPSADDIAFLFAANAGVHVATSAGNSGPGPATIGGPGHMPWLTTVGASTQERFFQGTIKLDNDNSKDTNLDRNNKKEYEGASITLGTDELPLVDAEFAGGDLCIPGTLDASVVADKIVLCRRGEIGRVEKSLAVFQAGGAGMIMYNNSDADNLHTDTHWVPSVHIDNTPGLEIKDYIANNSNPQAEIRVDKNKKWKPAPSMTIFSSRGPNPTIEDIIKPDITAPGLQILAGNTPTPIEGVPDELFQAIAGTSMSSPHIAGIFALIDQAHPDWSPAMVKSAIMTTAHQDVVDNDRTSQAGPFAMGSGHVNVGKPDKKGSAFRPGLVYDAGLFEYAAFTCGMEFAVFAPDVCDFLAMAGVPSEPYNLNVPSIGIGKIVGSQTVVRTVTNMAGNEQSYKVKVDAPEGYEVTVTPSRLTLENRESATYEVTITNISAPIDEWGFGSLTWKSTKNNYQAYSPIAVKAALIDAPEAVSGSGDSGSASFDVSFGYTGSYTAAPHGLTADAPTSGDIGQDPDQTYPSDDDSPVGVQKIDYPITGAAFVRWEMAIPGDDDIDLFLEDSSGTIIAASTSGGTNELIELTLPPDDTYTMVVHGWSVPNAPLPYTLHYWEVPLASGGSLSVDSAPTSAVNDTTETIDISWSGLATGTTYLGAVSHTGDVGLMGLTLVEVDTQ